MVDLYSQISNPININTIDRVLDCYCSGRDFYGALVKCGKDNKVHNRYTPYYYDQFQLFIFDKWKKSIINYCRNIDNVREEYRDKILTVGRYIYNLNPKNAEEVNKIIHYYDKANPKLSDAMDEIRWDRLGEYSSWDHIDSSYVSYGRHRRNPIEHRLYLNTDSTYTHQVLLELVKRCHQDHVKYYFKYDICGDRDDTIVIYTDSKHVKVFINMLREIKRDLKIDEHFHTPPLLSGKIDGFIGYGSEPINGDKYSFNSKRENHLEKCIKDETIGWIKRNKDYKFIVNNKEMVYKDYIVEKMVQSKKKRLLRFAKEGQEALKYPGYTKSDIESRQFSEYIRSVLRNNFDYIINHSSDSNFHIDLKVRNGKVTFSRSDIDNMIIDQTKFIRKVSTKYKYDLIDRIRRTSKAEDIDPDNYSFDITRLQSLRNSNNNSSSNGKQYTYK